MLSEYGGGLTRTPQIAGLSWLTGLSYTKATAAFNFALNPNLNQIPGGAAITFTRASNATMYRPGDGWLVFAPNNMLTSSEDFTNANWTDAGCTVVNAAITRPSGISLANKIQEDISNGLHSITSNQTTNVVAGFYYTASVYIQAAERTTARVQLLTAGLWGGTNPSVIVDLVAGSILQQSASAVTPAITNVGGGWWRVQVTGLCTTSGTSGLVIFTTIGTTSSYQGVVGSGVYASGAVVEIGPYMQAYNFTNGAAYFGPRFDTNPTTLTARGLYIEEARTNLLTYSSDFTNVAWVSVDTTASIDATLSPEGIANCQLLTEGILGTAVSSQTVTITAGSTITSSIYIKRGNTDWLRLQGGSGGGTNGARLWFNAATGLIGTAVASGTGTYIGSSVQTLPNGWWRLQMTYTADVAGVTCILSVNSATADGLSIRVPNSTRYQYGAQTEVGTIPTSYIPTAAATATRAAEVAVINDGAWINQSAGTIYFRATIEGLTGAEQAGISLAIATTNNNNRITQYFSSASANPGIFINATSVTQINRNVAISIIAGTSFKTAGSYDIGNALEAASGTSAVASGNYALPACAIAVIGARPNGTNSLNGWVQEFTYYPMIMSAAQLQTLTI